nr:immunoglobulin light chain junction region [Macaca mulatta]
CCSYAGSYTTDIF